MMHFSSLVVSQAIFLFLALFPILLVSSFDKRYAQNGYINTYVCVLDYSHPIR